MRKTKEKHTLKCAYAQTRVRTHNKEIGWCVRTHKSLRMTSLKSHVVRDFGTFLAQF
ncbi:uncharacterized protein DS421_17g596450 [Arachis hypogaea]|nr:uncharacterized protein DS421_17g596450 [Arachis hypogaea]